jgi:hypothetical protein
MASGNVPRIDVNKADSLLDNNKYKVSLQHLNGLLAQLVRALDS